MSQPNDTTSENKFKRGDIVQLKTPDAPPMCVIEVVENANYGAQTIGDQNGVHCMWFDKKDRVQYRIFEPYSLIHYRAR